MQSQTKLQNLFTRYTKRRMDPNTNTNMNVNDPIPNETTLLRQREPSVYSEDGNRTASSTNCNNGQPVPVLSLSTPNKQKKLTTFQSVCIVIVVVVYGIATLIAAAGAVINNGGKGGCEVKYYK